MSNSYSFGYFSGLGHYKINAGSRYKLDTNHTQYSSSTLSDAMSMDGSVYNSYKKDGGGATVSDHQNINIADAMGALNKLSNLLDTPINQTSNPSLNPSNKNKLSDVVSFAGATSPSQPSGIAKGFSDNQMPNLNMQNLNNISGQLDGYGVEKLQKVLYKDINSMLSSANANLNTTEANYNVLLGQKDEAQANISTLNEEILNATSTKEEAQEEFDTSKSNLNAATETRDQLDTQLSNLDNEYSTLCENVKEKEKAKLTAQQNVSQCKSTVTSKESAFNSAKSLYESAEKALSSVPQKLEDGSINPEYEAAKVARDNAKTAKEQAERELNEAKETLKAVENDLSLAEADLDTAQKSKKEKLTDIQNTKSELSQLAKNCEKCQQQVETARQSYDASYENLDAANNNYQRFNQELESAQGVMTMSAEYEKKLEDAKLNVDKIEDVKEKAEKALESKNAALASEAIVDISQLKRENIRQAMLTNANKTDGVSIYKTPAENLLSLQNGSYSLDRDVHEKWMHGYAQNESNKFISREQTLYNVDGSFFEEAGCIRTPEGGYVNPENGHTYVDVGNGIWVDTSSTNYVTQYDGSDKFGSELIQTRLRANEQGIDQAIDNYLYRDSSTGRWRLLDY